MSAAGAEVEPPAERAAGARGSRRACALAAILIVGMVLVAYAGALDNPFVFDDHATILGNPSLEDLRNWRWVLIYERFRPLVNVSHALERAAFGVDPGSHHATNVLLHAIVALLAAALARDVVADACGTRDACGSGAAGLLVGLLVAVHPLLSSAAGYVSARSDLLCGALMLGAVHAGRRAVRRGGWRPRAAALLLGVLAVLAKETGAVLPLLLWMDDWLLGPGTARAGQPPPRPEEVLASRARERRLWVPLAALLVLGGLFRVYHFGDETRFPFASAWRYSLAQPGVIWRYLGLLVVPWGQSIAHDVPLPERPTQLSFLLALEMLLLAVFLALRVRREHPGLAWGTLWLLVTVAPSSSIVPLVERMAEHRMYIPGIGPFVALASVVVPAAVAAGRAARRAAMVAAAIAIVALTALTVRRNEVMGDPTALWSEAVASAPELFAPHYWLGEAYRQRGDCETALAHFLDAIPLYPMEPLVYEGTSLCLLEVDSHDETAEALLANVSGMVPDLPGPWLCRAVIARRRENPALVESLLGEALARCRAQEHPHRVCDLLVNPEGAAGRALAAP